MFESAFVLPKDEKPDGLGAASLGSLAHDFALYRTEAHAKLFVQ
jgi:hypothetical protein